MTGRQWLAAGSAVTLLGVLLAAGWPQRESPRMADDAPPLSSTEPGQSERSEAPASPVTRSSPARDTLASDAVRQAATLETHGYIPELLDFRTRLHQFLDRARDHPRDDYRATVDQLLVDVDRLERKRLLTEPEALTLRLYLRRHILTPQKYRTEAQALVAQAKDRAETAMREWEARRDPKLDAYRAREREIVQQAMAVASFPDGMTRQQYLRRELAALRHRIFSSASTAPADPSSVPDEGFHPGSDGD